MDKELMDILKSLLEGQKRLEEGQIKFGEKLNKFEDKQNKFEEKQNNFEEKQNKFEEKLNNFDSRQDETYQMIKALVHSSEVNKAEHDKMMYDIAYIKGDVKVIKDDLARVEFATASNWADIAKLKSIK